jgi:hypothetical protein
MDADPDEAKLRTRRAATGLRNKKKFGQASRGLEPRQFIALVSGIGLVAWGLVVTFLLLRLGIMYTFDTIAVTRQGYSVEGAAHWAKTVASKEVMQAIEVWDLINASIVGLVYRAPEDFTNLGNVLSPAFDTMPLLHSVDLAFSDRDWEVCITRKKVTENEKPRAADARSLSFMQSNSDDCFLMGVAGCVDQPTSESHVGTPKRPDWYTFAEGLNLKPEGGVFYWGSEPELVVESLTDGGDLISPSVRLMFKVAFPTYIDKTSGDNAHTLVMGRVTVKLAALGGDSLVDERLGEDGEILLCDATGAVIASRNSDDLLIVDNGQVRFKNFWELGENWAGSVRSAFTGSSVRQMEVDDGDTFVAVEPLAYPLSRFAVIVVAPSWEPFQNVALMGTSAVASIVAPAPYALTGALAVVFFSVQCVKTAMVADQSTGIDSGSGRVSVSATLARAVTIPTASAAPSTTLGGRLKRLFGRGG